ncbi:hypothetical protein COO60DRAFT_985055 [Scenedesmus sp. NREL 46B-D3]|nr:hypothetical protein COO60DRAFT_985055 [Scenedesmus sp. NREL 46B-D3]
MGWMCNVRPVPDSWYAFSRCTWRLPQAASQRSTLEPTHAGHRSSGSWHLRCTLSIDSVLGMHRRFACCKVEEGTPFARWFSGDGSPLPKEPEAVAMFEAASATLTAAGYEHYEISNYAKPGHRSRHNQVYWKCQPYYAFGLGAASYTQGRRFSRPRGMHEYESWVQRFVQSGGGCPAAALPAESKEEQLLDLIMLSLRLSDGLALHSVQQEYGQDTVASLLPTIQGFLQEGLMQIVPELQQSGDDSAPEPGGCVSDADGYGDEAFGQLCRRLKQGKQCRVRLADPAGFLLSNDVISELFAQLDPSTLSQVL